MMEENAITLPNSTAKTAPIATQRGCPGIFKKGYNPMRESQLLNCKGVAQGLGTINGKSPIESYQLETMAAIQRLTVLTLAVAVQLLQVLKGREQPPWNRSLTPEQCHCWEQLASTLAGRTAKPQHPYPRESLAWASWVVARLGGWSGDRSQRPPGIKTWARGLREFEAIVRSRELRQSSKKSPLKQFRGLSLLFAVESGGKERWQRRLTVFAKMPTGF
jgi:hypothetical protein